MKRKKPASKHNLERNVRRGDFAEHTAKKDYIKEGFNLTPTRVGSDFKAQITLDDGTIYFEYVEVKSGNGRLSKKQKRMQQKCKKDGIPYRIYRVNDEFIDNNFGKIKKNKDNLPKSDKFSGTLRIPSMATCPNCKTIASGLNEILKKFGLRKIGKYVYSQSWCHFCRFPLGGCVA